MTNLTEHFTTEELACKCCGRCHMDSEFMSMLEDVRVEYGKPMIITSGYRCPAHNDAVSGTGVSGPHTTGRSSDIAVRGHDAHRLLKIIMNDGRFTGIGIKQSGNGRFIHVDNLDGPTRNWIWSY